MLNNINDNGESVVVYNNASNHDVLFANNECESNACSS